METNDFRAIRSSHYFVGHHVNRINFFFAEAPPPSSSAAEATATAARKNLNVSNLSCTHIHSSIQPLIYICMHKHVHTQAFQSKAFMFWLEWMNGNTGFAHSIIILLLLLLLSFLAFFHWIAFFGISHFLLLSSKWTVNQPDSARLFLSFIVVVVPFSLLSTWKYEKSLLYSYNIQLTRWILWNWKRRSKSSGRGRRRGKHVIYVQKCVWMGIC